MILAGSKARAVAPEYGGEPAAERRAARALTYGAYLAHRTGLPVLVTGTPTEAQAMRATLARDFAVQVRWVESHSRDTFENAQLSARDPARAGHHARAAGHRCRARVARQRRVRRAQAWPWCRPR